MKILKFFLVLALIIVSVKMGVLCFDGYTMYKAVVDEQSLENRVGEEQEKEYFVQLEDVSDYFIEALVSVEDRDFYKHGAISIKSFIRALVTDIKSGEYTKGGSTITQQTAKNLCFSMDKSLERKIAELFVASKLESLYSKDDILELYINIIYYGDGYTGIYSASHGYFGKSPSELNIDEATLLAGLPKSPSLYALSSNMDKALERRKEVVEAMVDNEALTYEEAEAVINNYIKY